MESLTPKRMEILKKARLERGFTNVWMERSCMNVQQKIKLSYITSNIKVVVIVAVNGSKDLCYLYAFYIFIFIFGDLVCYFVLFQNIYYSDNAPLINTFIRNIENILQFLISTLPFPHKSIVWILLQILQKNQTYFYDALIILLCSKYNRSYQ